MKTQHTLSILLFLWISSFCNAQEIASFNSDSDSTCSGTVYTNPNITASGICRGPGILEANGITYNSKNWTTSSTIDPTDYLEWTLTPDPGYQISLHSMDIRYDRSGTGPTQLEIQINTGSGFSSIFTDNTINESGENNDGINLYSFQNITSTITFRLHAYNASGNTGTFDIEERHPSNKGIIVYGSVNTTTSHPELQLIDDNSNYQYCGYNIDFGYQQANLATTSNFNIFNEGTANLNISTFTLSGTNSDEFSIISPTAPFSIPPGNTEEVTIQFTPSSAEMKSALLTINNNDNTEGSCTINLEGEGYTPAPEIDVERNTFASIPSGAMATTGYNTIFASTNIGNVTAPKTYYIRNEGTANLDVTSISSSNPSEFTITTNPSPSTLLSSEYISFDVQFNPSNTGTRTTTINISSSDNDESNYTFQIQGNGQCYANALTIYPQSGPIGTVVTALGNNFSETSSATINGNSASVNYIDSNTLEVTIPENATTGNLIISDLYNCLNDAFFTVINSYISGCEGDNGSSPSNLFISEVNDKNTGSHNFIELYNGTGSAVNLDNYTLGVYHNGSNSATETIILSGNLANNDTYLIAIGFPEADSAVGGHLPDIYLNQLGIGLNEDDNVRLFHNNNCIDIWGDTSGNPFTPSSNNYTYRRKNQEISAPSIIWNPNDWHIFSPADYSDINSYDFSTGIPPEIILQPSLSPSNCSLTYSLTTLATEGYIGGNSLTYQWYYSAPNETGWSAITDNEIYSGFASNELTILDTSNLDGYNFYCEIREDDQLCSSSSEAIHLQVETTFWNGNSWTNGIPNNNTIAVLNGDYNTETDASFSACNLLINEGHTLNIANNTYLEIDKDIWVYGNLIVETQGALVQNNDSSDFLILDNGVASVTKETPIKQAWYYYTYWSSPVSDLTIEEAFPNTPPNRRFYFDASSFEDSNGDDIDDDDNDWQIASGSSILQAGTGYAATASPQYSYPTSETITFTGSFNNGLITTPIIANPNPGNNWNFIGNPYPSAIDFDSLHSINTLIIDGAAYLWSQSLPPNANNPGNETLNFNQSDYAIITSGSGNVAGSSGIIPNNFIPSGQGFFVNGLSNGNLEFNNSMRMADNTSNQQFFKVTIDDEEPHNKLWLNLTTEGGLFSQILIAYVSGATDGLDAMAFDAPRSTSSGNTICFYSQIPDNPIKLAIQGKSSSSLTLQETIPLGFISNAESPISYNLNIAQYSGSFMENTPVYIKDNLLGVLWNLKESEYNFTSGTGTFNNRFEIVFSEETLNSNSNNNLNNDVLVISNGDNQIAFKSLNSTPIIHIKIYDNLGRLLFNKKTNQNYYQLTHPFAYPHIYFADIRLENGAKITKKFIIRAP